MGINDGKSCNVVNTIKNNPFGNGYTTYVWWFGDGLWLFYPHYLVGGLNPSEKYESQWEGWHPIYEMENSLNPPASYKWLLMGINDA